MKNDRSKWTEMSAQLEIWAAIKIQVITRHSSNPGTKKKFRIPLGRTAALYYCSRHGEGSLRRYVWIGYGTNERKDGRK